MSGCNCVLAFPEQARTQRTIRKPLKVGTVQEKSIRFLQNYTMEYGYLCKAFMNGQLHDISPFSEVSASVLKKQCQNAVYPPISQLPAADAQAPNLFANNRFNGSGSISISSGNSLYLPDWDAPSGMINVYTGVEDLGNNKTQDNQYMIMGTFTESQKNVTVSQTVSGLTKGKYYHVFANEAWSCMSTAKPKNGTCEWSITAGKQQIFYRQLDGSVPYSESYPKRPYPRRYINSKGYSFTATSEEMKITFRVARPFLDDGSATWSLKNVTLTGPWDAPSK
ncbi:hypothetical protein B9Z65_5997 [Elsinoe australis]|uniref:Uncharacterized protein n=1 Tax=Elsinoe australis TaxID=40998 RepID=A0A2P7YJP0_9PEZI|nr:hypothetical protein B9Z65_5997 [Elsinoe australis]